MKNPEQPPYGSTPTISSANESSSLPVSILSEAVSSLQAWVEIISNLNKNLKFFS